MTVQVKISKTSARVFKAWTKKTAIVTLKIVDLMFKDLPGLVKDLSGEGDSVPTDILDRLTIFEKSFVKSRIGITSRTCRMQSSTYCT